MNPESDDKMQSEQGAPTSHKSNHATKALGKVRWSLACGAVAAVSSLLAACGQTPTKPESTVTTLAPRVAASQPKAAGLADAEAARDREAIEASRKSALQPFVSLGSGELVRPPRRALPQPADAGPPLSLNFENGDVRELVKNIIVDTFQENVIIDPRVTGTVTIRTPKGLARNELIPVLDTLLRSVGFVLLKDGSTWRVLPAAEAVQGTTTPRPNVRNIGPGAGVVILPVKYVGAKELQRLIQPFVKTPEASIRVDEVRNLLFLFGTENEIRHMVEIAEMFDVDLLSGMSFVIYPLQSAEVKSVVADWERIFPAASNPLAGLVRLIPIERMNALLVISPNPEVIQEAKRMLERLDNGNDAGGGARLYVYNVQYTQAEKLQATLQQAMSGRAAPSQASVAPGQTQSTLSAPLSPIPGQGLVTPGNVSNQSVATTQPIRPVVPVSAGSANQAAALARNATVIADKDRNALLIVATPSEYSAIESAIKKLDTPPKMIAIEVQIAQVALTGELQFGISGMFSGKPESPLNRLTSEGGVGVLGAASGSSSSSFSYTWQGAAAKAILSTLQTKGQSRTIASPTLLTLDNQKVSFTNGTQISVQTQSTVATTTTTATNSYQYINTGLTINITPRVSGENVFLEIQQQNSNAQPRNDGNPNPDIIQNSQQTTVMVANGDTMLLGGLFQDNSSFGSSGLPLVSTIPVVGGLFGNQGWKSSRSELVMLVTPRIMSTVAETRGVVDELRGKLRALESFVPEVNTTNLPTSADGQKARNKSELGEYSRSLRVPVQLPVQ